MNESDREVQNNVKGASNKEKTGREKVDEVLDGSAAEYLSKLGVPKSIAKHAVKSNGGALSPINTPLNKAIKNKSRNALGGLVGSEGKTKNTAAKTGKINQFGRHRNGILGRLTNGFGNQDAGASSSNDAEASKVDTNASQSVADSEQNISNAGNTADNVVQKATAKVKKLVLKVLLTLTVKIILSILLFFVFLLLFIVVLCSPLIALGIVDLGEITDSFQASLTSTPSTSPPASPTNVNFVPTTDSTSLFFPIGSEEVTNSGGVTYASGTPIGFKISSGFGGRDAPTAESGDFHTGIDIIASPYRGTGVVNVVAAGDGVVDIANDIGCADSTKTTGDHNCGGMLGNYVKIKHGDGMITVYGHMFAGSITVKTGDSVKRGQVIGKIGSSGNSTGPHLHFGVYVNGSYVNPLEYVSIDNTRPSYRTYEV